MSTSSKVRVLAVLFAAFGLLLAGCGGSDDDSASLTKAQLIKQGDAICRKADEQQAAAFQRELENIPDESIETQEKVVVAAELPPLQRAAEELDALGAPEGDEEQVEAIVSGMEEAVVEIEAKPIDYVEGDLGTLDEVGRLAKAYGFTDCAKAY